MTQSSEADLPVAIDAEVDEAWMSAALGRPGELRAMTRTSIGTGQVGENVRYELSWDDGVDPSTVPASVVGKYPSLDELSRQTAAATSAYVREVGFYRDLQSGVSIPTPKLFHLGEDLDANRFVLIMQDLKHADQGDQLAGCTPEAATRVVAALGGLHGPMWGRNLSEELPWIGARDAERAHQVTELLAAVAPGFRARYSGRLDDDVMTAVDWVSDHHDRWSASFETSQTLVHGDYRLDNLLFGRADAEDAAPPLTVVDWQTAAMGHGPADAAYFVGAGLLPDVRVGAEDALIDTYHQSLVRAGVDVAVDVIERDWARGAVSGLLMAVIASQIVGQTERGDEMFCVMAERHTAQMLDRGVRDLIG